MRFFGDKDRVNVAQGTDKICVVRCVKRRYLFVAAEGLHHDRLRISASNSGGAGDDPNILI